MSGAITPLIIYASWRVKGKLYPFYILSFSLLSVISYCFRDNVSIPETLSIIRHEVSYSVGATLSKQLAVSLESDNSTH